MKENIMNNSGIYKITNKTNGKFYIGSSKHIDRRWWEHTNDLIKNEHCNTKLQHAWNYHGKDAFEFTILENVDIDKLEEREVFYLKTFKPYMRDIGYNISDSYCGGNNFTNNSNKENIRKVLSDMHLGELNPMFGKTHSESAKKLQKQKSVGRYTIDWFKSRYGDEEGSKKYQERNDALRNRKMNHVYDNGLTGTKREPMSDINKKKISDNKARLKLLKPQILIDIKSNLYTNKVLAERYETSTTMIKYYKKQIKSGIV
jgi:group I intron endonuclease